MVTVMSTNPSDEPLAADMWWSKIVAPRGDSPFGDEDDRGGVDGLSRGEATGYFPPRAVAGDSTAIHHPVRRASHGGLVAGSAGPAWRHAGSGSGPIATCRYGFGQQPLLTGD